MELWLYGLFAVQSFKRKVSVEVFYGVLKFFSLGQQSQNSKVQLENRTYYEVENYFVFIRFSVVLPFLMVGCACLVYFLTQL